MEDYLGKPVPEKIPLPQGEDKYIFSFVLVSSMEGGSNDLSLL